MSRRQDGLPARVGGGLGLALLVATTLSAADMPPDPDLATEGMKRLGPFYTRPFVALRDAGYDDNVRLEAEDRQGDTTATFGGGIEALLLTGDRGGLRLFNELDYVAFARNADLAHWNGRARARGVLLLRKTAVSLEEDFFSVRERPNNEVDQRLRRENNAITATLRTLNKGRLKMKSSLRQESIGYSSGEPSGEEAARRLDRNERSLTISGDLAILPKTTFTTEGAIRRIEFVRVDEGRDSREVSVLLGLRFDPSASIQGSFSIGRADLTLPDQPENSFRGAVGEGQLSMRLGHFARVKTTFQRGAEFSSLANNPYYVNSGWTAAYEQLLSRRVSAELLYGRGKNHYPEPVTLTRPPARPGIRDDRLTTYEVGVRFRAADQLSIAAQAHRFIRDSTDDFYDRQRNVYAITSRFDF